MAAIMRRVIVGLALVSSYTMASPVPSDASGPGPRPSPHPWEILYPGVDDGNIITVGGASLLDNDLIVMANGYKLVHYNIKNATTTVIQSPSDYMLDAWGASKKEIWAVGSMELGSTAGKVGRFNGDKWEDYALGFTIPLGVTLRAIYGTSASNIWATGGSGEMPGSGVGGKTGVVLFFNGRTWTKVIDAGIYCTGVSVFARGKDVWIGLVDGSILYSNDGFKTRSIIPYSGRGFDTGVNKMWASATSDIYIGANIGLYSIKNVGCKALLKMTLLTDGPGASALVGGFPGLPENVLYTGSSGGYSALWNGKSLVQDPDSPNRNISQSYYRSIMLAAPDAQGKTYMYAMATDAFLARRQV
ncbi:hypothetical protein BC829DRAFT_393293 [Chytridium lagenaria]|nr:hypothetical protein BC829DRAFT_393293 [Chytridium lagenaria]